jgi:hypothetical protein
MFRQTNRVMAKQSGVESAIGKFSARRRFRAFAPKAGLVAAAEQIPVRHKAVARASPTSTGAAVEGFG